MKWKHLLVMIAIALGVFYLFRPRGQSFEEQAQGAPFYMGYNQPARNQNQGGAEISQPPFDRNARPCVGCNPEVSEVLAGKARDLNAIVDKREQQLNDYVKEVNNYLGAYHGSITIGVF